MALNEFVYSVRVFVAMNEVTISTTSRLQDWGQNVHLYANKQFKTPTLEGASRLLGSFLTLARRNDSGIDSLTVTPFSITIKAGALSPEKVEKMFLSATRLAGMTAVKVKLVA